METIQTFITEQIPAGLQFVRQSRIVPIQELSPITIGIILQIITIIGLILLLWKGKNTKFWQAIEMFFDTMYEFFEEILGEKESKAVKIYVVTLFFVILLANLLSYSIDLIRVAFVDVNAILSYIYIPTTDFNFNIALAVVSVVLMLILQIKTLRPIKFFLEYIPITGKGILDIERGSMSAIVYYPAKVIIKLFDIAISLFVWFLDIVGIAAKVLSLSARLYGNMLAGGILLWLLVVWVNGLTQNIAGADFPILAPLVLYAQWLLVAVIQAFVFPLLVAIFIKIAKGQD